MLGSVESQIYTQVAVLQRNESGRTQFGAEKEAEWVTHATTPCRAWWWKGSRSSDKSPSSQYARPETTVNETGGDMAMPLGVDVTDEDRLLRLEDEEGNVIEEGPYRIIAVNHYDDHIELTLAKP